jgi:hypothetical protein
MVVVAAVVAVMLHRRHLIGRQTLLVIGVCLVIVLTTCSAFPRWFRGFYRAGMTVSFQLGQVMGRVLLTLFFLLNRAAKTYWQPAKTSTQFDRQF